MSSIAVVVSVVYSIIDISAGIRTGLPFYGALLLLSAITFFLNRRRQYTLSSVVFLTACNVIIFLFSSGDINRTGVYMYFLSIAVSSFVLFGLQKPVYSIGFSILPAVLFFVSYWGDVHLMPTMRFTDEYMKFIFATNFSVALLASLLQIIFLVMVNHSAEQELIHTAQELERTQERNDMVIHAVNAGVYEWSIPNNYVRISNQWKALLGWGENELQEVNLVSFLEMVHPEDRDRMQGTIDLHFKNRKPYSSEVRIRMKNGEYRWFIDSGITKFGPNGAPLLTVGSIINIHEMKLSEEKIRVQNELLGKANKELDSFVYSVSHDLRAPLSSILGLTNVYTMSTDAADKDDIVKLINNRASALDSFIKEVLDYSRNSRQELKITPLTILEVVREVVQGLNYMEGYDQLLIHIDIDPRFVVNCDYERLKVVLNNFISNAVKYRDPAKDSYIRIRASAGTSRWQLVIEDNGIGIRPEHVNKIFDMFYQAHTQSKGSGLGLYIVTETLNKLNGSVKVDSTFEVGSTFTIELPLTFEPVM